MSQSPRSNPATDPVSRVVYATDNSIYQVAPHGVLVPETAQDVADYLAANFAAAVRRPVVARGGGTGTNGQSLTDGVVIDVKRRMNRMLSLDVANRTAVVQPGMVTGALNAELASHGLFWAPHTSTLNRATVGGMISTDAAGKGSAVHGRASRHVLALDVLLDDGTSWRAEPTPLAEAKRLADRANRVGRLWRDLLVLPVTAETDLGLPELARGFSGYGIDRLRPATEIEVIDPVPLLCGAEGTLAVITAATLRLTAIAAHTELVVAGYDQFGAALDDAVELVDLVAPDAIESFDETTLERGRSSPAWPALGEVVGDRDGSVLLLEFSGADPSAVADRVARLGAALADTGRSYGHQVITDPDRRAAAWKVRADAVGLLAKVATGGPERSARPTAMVEDCAVPVTEMPAFIDGFRRILDGHGLTYGMFGHADVGCVHVRPALDLTDPAHAALVRAVTDEVTALVARHGGILWGEHGRGFRGDVADAFLPPATLDLMRAVKTAFDPDDLLNPGKLYRPLGVDEPLIALDQVPMRGATDRRVPLKVRHRFADAFACNGNGLCHHHDGAEVMCPSYKATGDPALSPKGRADLLRAWLVAEEAPGPTPDPDAETERSRLGQALAQNLDQCLSCSACSGRCPVEVDIPELKSRFLDRYHRTTGRPFAHRFLSRFEAMAGLGRTAPGWVTSAGVRVAGPLLGLVDLPTPKRDRSAEAPPTPWRPGQPAAADVVILPDVFTATLDPATLNAAVMVLRRLDYEVAQAPFRSSGKFDHVKGRRRAFAKAVVGQADLVRAATAVGMTPVVVEPAVALLHGREYPAIAPDFPNGTQNLVQVIEARIDRLGPAATPQDVTLLGHCTERTTAPSWPAAWTRVLEAAGHGVDVPDVGCCGMAGIFGHEVGNQEMSRSLYDLTWADPVARSSSPGRVAAATGYSCRSQAARFGQAEVIHPVRLL